MKKLNKLEKTILERLQTKYPNIKFHLPLLEVESREITGVGMYINLSYCSPIEKKWDLEINDSSISTNETIILEGLKHGISYEVDVTSGKLRFIELVTHGEKWDGRISENFSFE
jgi:hypothetical protein